MIPTHVLFHFWYVTLYSSRTQFVRHSSLSFLSYIAIMVCTPTMYELTNVPA